MAVFFPCRYVFPLRPLVSSHLLLTGWFVPKLLRGLGRSRSNPGNTAHRVGIHPGWITSPSQSTMLTYSYPVSVRVTSSPYQQVFGKWEENKELEETHIKSTHETWHMC